MRNGTPTLCCGVARTVRMILPLVPIHPAGTAVSSGAGLDHHSTAWRRWRSRPALAPAATNVVRRGRGRLCRRAVEHRFISSLALALASLVSARSAPMVDIFAISSGWALRASTLIPALCMELM